MVKISEKILNLEPDCGLTVLVDMPNAFRRFLGCSRTGISGSEPTGSQAHRQEAIKPGFPKMIL